MQLLPDSITSPFPPIVIDRLPRREVAREQAPGTATANDVENGIDDGPSTMDERAASVINGWEIWLHNRPFIV